MNSTPGGDAGLGAQPVGRVVHVGRRPGVQPGDRDVALVVVQRGEQPAQRHQRVGHQPAPHAGVHRVGQRAHARRRRGPARAGWWSGPGTPMSQLPLSAITITSAAR